MEYRSLGKVGKKTREQLKEEAFEFFERYLEIESILHLLPEAFARVDLRGTAEAELVALKEE
ncbi:MAG: hypothetical protein PF795_06855 [Kiritimatiellae bacterium]|nr:hypothetical protein [Kiritimatiellia bacterium]